MLCCTETATTTILDVTVPSLWSMHCLLQRHVVAIQCHTHKPFLKHMSIIFLVFQLAAFQEVSFSVFPNRWFITKPVTVINSQLMLIIILIIIINIVVCQGFAWLKRRVLDLMIQFIGPVCNLLQHFTNHHLRLDILDFWPHYTNPLLSLSLAGLGFWLYSLRLDLTENMSTTQQ
jgi:hypothetical protein